MLIVIWVVSSFTLNCGWKTEWVNLAFILIIKCIITINYIETTKCQIVIGMMFMLNWEEIAQVEFSWNILPIDLCTLIHMLFKCPNSSCCLLIILWSCFYVLYSLLIINLFCSVKSLPKLICQKIFSGELNILSINLVYKLYIFQLWNIVYVIKSNYKQIYWLTVLLWLNSM